MLNFNRPYFATNPADFWRRWHISLSTWLRDYLYIPLGGNRHGPLKTYRNLMLTMLIGGLWHGAAWHFVAWGLFHGILLCLHRLTAPFFARLPVARLPSGSIGQRAWHALAIIAFFHITCFGWLLFAVRGLPDVPLLLHNMVAPFELNGRFLVMTLLLFAGPLLLMEWAEERYDQTLIVKSWPRPVRLTCYAAVLAAIILCGALERHEFIYFQF
jgi:D-alanyl-lipoteichoic acid acyltransferase DltB (MBOAT superfamily)